jgi:hypothetical protein
MKDCGCFQPKDGTTGNNSKTSDTSNKRLTKLNRNGKRIQSSFGKSGYKCTNEAESLLENT